MLPPASQPTKEDKESKERLKNNELVEETKEPQKESQGERMSASPEKLSAPLPFAESPFENSKGATSPCSGRVDAQLKVYMEVSNMTAYIFYRRA